MGDRDSQRGRLILVGVLSVIAFALVIVLYVQMKVFNGSGSDEPVQASTENSNGNKQSGKNDPDAGNKADPTPTGPVFMEGFKINGVDVSGKTLEDVKLSVADAAGESPADKVKVSFIVGEDKVEGDSGLLTFGVDFEDVLNKAWNASLSGDDSQKEYQVSWTVYEESVKQFVHNALDSYAKEPVDARASAFDTQSLTFLIEDEVPGLAIDFDKIIDSITQSLDSNSYEFEIPVETTVVEPETTAEFLRGYLCKVSSTTSTTTSSSNRNTNIRLVCEKLDGLVIQPGEQFDFNKYIGERTEAAGFKEAGGIYNGALRQELGGGICQANAMIFHSVVKADLQVDTRSPHTWPSDYVEIGTDATVSWGGPEFRFTNNSDYPVALHAYYGNQKVTVELYGRPLPDGMTIKLKGEETSRTEAKVEYVADSDMELDKKVTDKSGHDAIKAKAYKIYYDAEGKEIRREEAFYSSYPMINKVVRVGTRAEDGTIFKLNKETGETIAPEGYVPPTPTPDQEDPDDLEDDPKPTKKPKKDKNENPTSEPDSQAEDTGDNGNGEGSGGSENPGDESSTEENYPVPGAENTAD